MADYSGGVTPAYDLGTIPSNTMTRGKGGATGLMSWGTPSYGGIWTHYLTTKLGLDYRGEEDFTISDMWFERIWYIPAEIALGNILTTVVRAIEIYNSHREDPLTLSSAVANAGAGITLVGLPALPTEIAAQDGISFDMWASTQGQPTIDGTLDFITSLLNFSIPVTGSRVVMFPYEPETPIREVLKFKTDVIIAADGSEQRINVRKRPRQSAQMSYLIEEGPHRRQVNTLLKGWHERVYGVPVWWEARPISGAAAAASSTIDVSTLYGDFRVGGLAIVWSDEDTYDALEIDSLTDTTITFSSPLSQDHNATALVMPLRVAYTGSTIEGSVHLNNLQTLQMQFDMIDNDVDLEDTGAFSSYNGKVMLDDPNMVSTTLTTSLHRKIQEIDNGLGSKLQFSDWLNSRPMTRKTFLGSNLEATWNVRQLVHAFHGSQQSFYLPTFYADLEAVQDLNASSNILDIADIRYRDYINADSPSASIRITLVDGTLLLRTVLSASEVGSGTERLIVDTVWDTLVPVADIVQISFLHLVRIADDRVVFEHEAGGTSTVQMNVSGVNA